MEETMLRVASFFKEEKDPFYRRGAEKERARAQKERAKAEKEIAKLQARAKKAEIDKLESAQTLKKSGVAVQVIASSLNLPIDVVEKL